MTIEEIIAKIETTLKQRQTEADNGRQQNYQNIKHNEKHRYT